MLIPFYFLVNVECLEFDQDLDDGLLHPSLGHQGPVLWSGESFLSDLDPVDGPHAVSDLVVLLGHELTATSVKVLVVVVLKDENLALLSKVDLIEYLDAWIARVQVVVEM